jgi:hypothetical protein
MRPAFWLLASLALLGTGSGCAGCGQCALGALEGPINDPSNRALRRDILAKGIDRFCGEMVKHNAPLSLQQGMPAIGRFFPRTCNQQMLQNGDLFVQFTGVGYAWTNLSKKVTFSMNGTVTYDADFLMDGCTAYAFFKTHEVKGADFQTIVIEQPVANFINQLTPMGNQFGSQLVNAQLQQGFTVILDKDQNADFGLGMIPRGQRPVHPFDLHGTNRITYENTTADVHVNQRDFVGPIVIEENNRAIYVQASLQGTQAVDVLFMNKQEADFMLDQYVRQGPATPLPGPLSLGGDVLQQGAPYNGMRVVPPGTYYVVFDNSATAGQVAPVVNLLSDPAATISYAVQIGDKP